MRNKDTYIRVLKWLLLSLAFVPLAVVHMSLFPFIFGKTLFIRIVVSLAWVIFSALILFRGSDGSFLGRTRSRLISTAKNPLSLFIYLYTLVMLFSTSFAFDAYRAFFGDIERGEGYLGMLYFLGFFLLSVLVFRRKDWLSFFKLSLVTGVILFIHGLYQYNVYQRIQSLIGNPAFLANIFIFTIFAALIVIVLDKATWWKTTAKLVMALSFVGILLTETRSALLGLIIGVAFTIFYLAIKGGGLKLWKIDVQRVSAWSILLGFLFISILFVTRANPVWLSVPGVDRLVTVSFDDPTVQTRLISAGVSFDAVKSSDNDWRRTLLGWGPENFNVAYNEYYNPEYLRYEGLWFDRAHNKLLDVLVMNGALGILTYMGIWSAIFYLIFRKKKLHSLDHESDVARLHEISAKNVYVSASILFFAVAYFVQNLFLFDQISTYIPMFAFLGFTVYYFTELDEKDVTDEGISSVHFLFPYAPALIASFFLYFLVTASIIPFYQSKRFVALMSSGDIQHVYDEVDGFTKPYTYGQAELRYRMLQLVTPYIGNEGARPLVDKAIALHEEVVNMELKDPRPLVLLAGAYQAKGDQGDLDAYVKAEDFFLKALALSPKRQELLYNMAVIYADQGDFVRMNEYADRLLSGSPDVPMTKIYYATAISREGVERFNEAMDQLESALDNLAIAFDRGQIDILRNVYNRYLNYFFDRRDSERFLAAMERAFKLEVTIETIDENDFKFGRLKELPPKKSQDLAKGIEIFKEFGWAGINKE